MNRSDYARMCSILLLFCFVGPFESEPRSPVHWISLERGTLRGPAYTVRSPRANPEGCTYKLQPGLNFPLSVHEK